MTSHSDIHAQVDVYLNLPIMNFIPRQPIPAAHNIIEDKTEIINIYFYSIYYFYYKDDKLPNDDGS